MSTTVKAAWVGVIGGVLVALITGLMGYIGPSKSTPKGNTFEGNITQQTKGDSAPAIMGSGGDVSITIDKR